jgi:RHH-type transcriptional regulator, proline utilization regulon repressor / proline dehydrogenase / delta 1-pyrroline-5-carboxylate dehydrogenase
MLEAHEQRMRGEARLIKSVRPGRGTERGSFFGPTAFELDRLGRLEREVFGPILHVVRYEADQLDSVVEQINATGYGLTLGIHTRIDETWQRIAAKARVGNIYVNRNQIGALVGIQPFGGMGLSGTGPKAGGPHYLHRFMAMRGAAEPAPQDSAQEPEQEPAEMTVDFGVVAGAVHRALKGAVPDLEARARIIEQVATSIGGAAAGHLRFFAAEARDALESAEPLPGPTGERNELGLEPRGIFACIAADIDALTAQAAAAFVTGNRVLLVGPEARTVASRFKSAGLAEGVLGAVLPGGDSTLEDLARSPALDGIAVAAPATIAARIAGALAAPDGPIRPLVPWASTPTGGIGHPAPGTPHYLHRFMTEKTISNDTTASGGNASLLAIGGDES